ncbi:unnamed protein product [Orchesella dallaii]|uniref:Integral membrane protein 2 n=1 Tax=Orchesella dallaii TaxID=48710 RepID=A0ABP1QLZ0_9HEXA
MTVITKPLTSEKKAADKTPLVVPVNAEGNVDLEKGAAVAAAVKAGQLEPGFNERYHYILKRSNVRVSNATTLCLLITALLVMTVGLFGGLYVYKQMSKYQRFRGWCNVPYAGTSAYHSSHLGMNRNGELTDPMLGVSQLDSTNGMNKMIDDDGLSKWYESDPDSDAQGAASFFREEFEIDLGNEKYSKVQVPDFKYGRLGRFIHEFDSNKTAIVDQTAKRCFIMPLDRERVLPPKSMYDMIEKMWKGYYSVNTHRVRETMRVVLPPLDDLSDVGEYIRQECEDKTTYRLEKSTDRIFKRSVGSTPEALPYTEFTGLATMEYDIINLNQINKIEGARK